MVVGSNIDVYYGSGDNTYIPRGNGLCGYPLWLLMPISPHGVEYRFYHCTGYYYSVGYIDDLHYNDNYGNLHGSHTTVISTVVVTKVITTAPITTTNATKLFTVVIPWDFLWFLTLAYYVVLLLWQI